MSQASKRQVWFWGCWFRPGHHLWSIFGDMHRHQDARLPWPNIDGTLAPGPINRYGEVETRDQVEGLARLHVKDNWTCVAWWDRSVDTRGGSNAAIIVPDVCDIEEALRIGRSVFPLIFHRFEYTIRGR